MGPPALAACAVEPALVATINPSPKNRGMAPPSTSPSSSMARKGCPAAKTTSLTAHPVAASWPSRSNRQCSACRFSMLNVPARMASRYRGNSSTSNAARKPRRPPETPKILEEAPASRTCRATRMMVPSPPTATTMSACPTSCTARSGTFAPRADRTPSATVVSQPSPITNSKVGEVMGIQHRTGARIWIPPQS